MVRNRFTPMGYRGLGHDISKAATIPDALEMAGLNWKPCRVRLEMVGREKRRPVEGWQALVRSDTGDLLSVTTTDYTPFSNEQILALMQEAAGLGDVRLEQAGSLDGGRRVWAMGTVPNSGFELPVDRHWADAMRHNPNHGWMPNDKTVIKVLITSGHVAGIALKVDLMAERQICVNGAKISRDLGAFSLTHTGHLDERARGRIAKLFEDSGIYVRRYADTMRRIHGIDVDSDESRAFVIQLLQPKILEDLVNDGRISDRARATQDTPKYQQFNGFFTAGLLDQIIGREERLFDPSLFNRPVEHVLELVDAQPGAAMAPGSLLNDYHAVTYYVDHERGRSEDTGLQAAWFGAGATLKDSALDLVVQYADAHQRS